MNEALLSGAFISMGAGFLGGLGHCSGMCGPIVAALSVGGLNRKEGKRSAEILPHILYNTGRVTTYTALGAMVGGAGSFVAVISPMEGAQYALMATTGTLMLLLGLSVAGATSRLTSMIEGFASPLLKSVNKLIKPIQGRQSSFRFLPLGLMLGLLPCGLSYTMLIGAAGSGGALTGAVLMLAFGLGTVPAMFAIGMLSGRIGLALRGKLYRAGGILVALMGLYYMYRGLSFYA